MKKRGSVLLIVTLISFICFLFIGFDLLAKYPSSFDNDFMSLTGNVALNLDESSVGDSIRGVIEINEVQEGEGILLLTKNDEELFVETFYLNDYIEGNSIQLEDLVNYTFEEPGNYELFFSALEVDINIKKEFIVK